MLYLVSVDQFRSKIHGRLLRLPEHSSESVWHDLMVSWALICGWEANQSIFQVSSPAHSCIGRTATVIPGSCCFCCTDLPHLPCVLPSHSLLHFSKKNPLLVYSSLVKRGYSLFYVAFFFSKTSSVLSYLYKQSHSFFLWITSAGFISFCGKYDMRFWLKWHFCLSKFSTLLKHQTEC